jgi:membrane protein DedA with SNARE-associated domain
MLPSESEQIINNKQGKPSLRNKNKIARIASILVVVALSVYIFSIRDRASEFAVYGYPGIFLLSFMAYATVLLPAPGIALIFSLGAVLNPFAVGLAAGAGAALGEISGYMVGFSGQAIIEKASIYARLMQWMKLNGILTVLLLSAIPNPFFDLAGAAAGASRMPMKKFLFWCWIGETIKMTFFAFTGAFSLSLFN